MICPSRRDQAPIKSTYRTLIRSQSRFPVRTAGAFRPPRWIRAPRPETTFPSGSLVARRHSRWNSATVTVRSPLGFIAQYLPISLKKTPGGIARWTPLRGKGLKIQGVIVRATRNPISSPRLEVPSLLRTAERRNQGLLYQEPPRKTRWEQSPLSHADPSTGAPR